MNNFINFEKEKKDNFSDDELYRMVEAILFASHSPLSLQDIKNRLPFECELEKIINELKMFYEKRGINLIKVGNAFAFRTSRDLKFLFKSEKIEIRKLSKAALETLSIIAYNNSVTRAEIEDIRGVCLSSGTIDILFSLNWIKFGRKRNTPGRPATFEISDEFLNHFGLESIEHLPGINELREMGIKQKEINFQK